MHGELAEDEIIGDRASALAKLLIGDASHLPNQTTRQEWLKIQSERKQRIRHYCDDKLAANLTAVAHQISLGRYITPHWSKNFVTHENFTFVNCNIPKAASTSIKIAIANITGKLHLPHNQPEFTFHKWTYLNNTGLIGMEYLPLEDIINRLQKYTSFVIVRHPIDRIISAYKDKIQSRGPSRISNIVVSIMKFCGIRKNRNSWRYVKITFPHFVDWLVTTKNNNAHWQSYRDLCFPCDINFTYIGHLETIDTDMFHIFNELIGTELALEVLKNNPRLNGGSARDVASLALHFKDLTLKQLRELNAYAGDDMDMFGYLPLTL
ncbi:hypothetical protein CAPTEDRAFT_201837 [Capitella teleta]|uniref:Carbohydrate sulfotransferase n=1 Tax=Capitella teleta TaxID=283909 RepID=R7UA84_CAPTE|nr:hypothetical protein CAPTEDRAFT_201837 [Capitella teleta]|eukprot:ELU03016.1 hypothetical protein CAPTEDRAFT_201837 [Capitella teleta]